MLFKTFLKDLLYYENLLCSVLSAVQKDGCIYCITKVSFENCMRCTLVLGRRAVRVRRGGETTISASQLEPIVATTLLVENGKSQARFA